MTQHEKIITHMCNAPAGTWFLPKDFMHPDMGDLFVGYEATARLSELAKEYPDMIQSQKEGRFIKRRIRFETGKEWYPGLPLHLKRIFQKETWKHATGAGV